LSDMESKPQRLDHLGLVGKVLENRFQIEEIIGEGAMGYVYKATQLRLRRPVAIKIPKPELARNSDYMSRFEREALTMAKCVHENIVAIYDVYIAKRPDEINYIAMEYVSGLEVYQYLLVNKENLNVKDVVALLRQFAKGLDAAHEAGVVHRDIKPSNLIVTLPQRVGKIMDFGIAKGEMENIFKTQCGPILGTPAFMAPEVIQGAPPSPASDIYAFGMALYKLFTRDLPFTATSTAGILVDHIHKKPIPLRKRNPAWPPALESVLANAIAKKPADRPFTACRLMDEIEEALSSVAEKPFAQFFASMQHKAVQPIAPAKKFGLAPMFLSGAAALIIIAAAGIGYFLKNKKHTDVQPILRPTPQPSPAPLIAIVRQTPPPAPTPAPTAPPSPTPAKTPAAMPSPTPPPQTPRPTPEPQPTPTPSRNIQWDDPDIWGAELSGNNKIIEMKKIDDIFVEGIRKPLFRGQTRRISEVLSEVEPDSRESFLNGLNKLIETHQNITISYIRTYEKIDGERAEISLRTGIKGKRKLAAAQGEETLVPIFETKIHLLKKQGEWFFVDWPRYFP